jgi:hypothetical protein
MSDYRKHHYVPVFYQNHLVNANGLLWVYDRRRGVYQELAPKVVCDQKDLYAVVNQGLGKDQRIESQALAAADAACAGAALRQLMIGKMPPDESTMETIAYFAALQSSRVPSTNQYVSDVYKKAVEEMMRLSGRKCGSDEIFNGRILEENWRRANCVPRVDGRSDSWKSY